MAASLAPLALVLACVVAPAVAEAQYRRAFDDRVSWSPAEGQDGVEFSARIKIVHDVYFGDPIIRHIAGEYQLGRFAVVKGQHVPLHGLSDAQRKRLTPRTLDVCYDIEANDAVVSTLCEGNVPSSAMSGSPPWSKLFPPLGASEAKALMKTGYRIMNVRITRAGGHDLSALGAGARRMEVRVVDGGEGFGWEVVEYRRDQNTVWVRFRDGRTESFDVCGGEEPFAADAGSAAPDDATVNAACARPGYEVSGAPQARCARMLIACTLAMLRENGERTGLSVTDVIIDQRPSPNAPWTRRVQPCTSMAVAEIVGLDPCTTYDVRMRSVCDDGSVSAWVAPFQMKTACPAPSKLSFGAAGPTSVVVRYLRPNGACHQSGRETLDLAYAPRRSGTWTTVSHAGGPLTLSGLTPGTKYKARMRLRYPNGATSAWTREASFETAR